MNNEYEINSKEYWDKRFNSGTVLRKACFSIILRFAVCPNGLCAT